jgi:hypothetical protein
MDGGKPGGIGRRWRVELGNVEEVKAVGGQEKWQDLVHNGGEARASTIVHAFHEDAERALVDVVQSYLTLGPLAPSVCSAQKRPQRLAEA